MENKVYFQTTNDSGPNLDFVEMEGIDLSDDPDGVTKTSSRLELQDNAPTSKKPVVTSRGSCGRITPCHVIIAAAIVIPAVIAVTVIAIYAPNREKSDHTGTAVPPPVQCNVTQWACLDGLTCIDAQSRCDDQVDCPMNGEDEQGCIPPPVQCDVTQWACLDGLTCIDAQSRCDDQVDCPMNGEDEQGCNQRCRAYQFDCGNGACVALHFRCNGRPDCSNGADEAGCDHEGQPCLPSHFTCNDGTCIPLHQRCNYFFECPDRSDELPELCGACNSVNEFQCEFGNCFPRYWQCDFYPDCLGGEDEENCPAVHGSELVSLDVGQAVNISSPNWPLPYQPGQYHQWNITVPNHAVVLLNIREISLSFQSFLTIFEGHDVSNDSNALDRLSYTDVPNIVRSFTNRACVRFHAGAYVGTRGFFIEVTALNYDDPRLPNCNANYFACDDGCIAASQVCDGTAHCVNGTDEAGCDLTTPTLTDGGCNAATEYECMKESNESRCIPQGDRCNYFLDCPLFDDELNCECREGDFRCRSGQCIPSYFVCDYYYDCLNGTEDEVTCGTPNNTYSYTLSGTESISIRSPNYPSNYPPGAYEVNYVLAPLGYLPVVVFDDFVIDWKGFISFGSGSDVTDHTSIFAVFDHHDDPKSVYVPTRAFFIEFHGGPYGRSRGFEVEIHAIKSDSV